MQKWSLVGCENSITNVDMKCLPDNKWSVRVTVIVTVTITNIFCLGYLPQSCEFLKAETMSVLLIIMFGA